MNPPPDRQMQIGVLFALFAYGAWGLHPLYFRLLSSASPVEIVSHRMIWSLVFLIAAVIVTHHWTDLRATLRSFRKLLILLATSLLLSINLGLFIYGINSHQVVEASLGNFIVPLVSVLLGVGFLRERLTPVQLIACALAAGGVLIFGLSLGHIPWLGLGIALAFGFYGLLRKIAAVTPLSGIVIETAFMTPPAIAILFWFSTAPLPSTPNSPLLLLGLIGTGLITSLPLWWFNEAAKRLNLSTLGFFQYLAPFLQLAIGVLFFQENFSAQKCVAFALIWSAILLYLGSAFFARQRRRVTYANAVFNPATTRSMSPRVL